MASSCASVETTEVRAGDIAFTPASTLVGRGSYIQAQFFGSDDIEPLAVFVATEGEVTCDAFEELASCDVVPALTQTNALVVTLKIAKTPFGDGLGPYAVPDDAIVRLHRVQGAPIEPPAGSVELVHLDDARGDVRWSVDESDLDDGAIAAPRCAALDAVLERCEENDL